MRKSLADIQHMVRNIPYPHPLPDDIAHLHTYVIDQGHCILSVPQVFLMEAQGAGMDMYELPLPVRYVLQKGYWIKDGYCIVDVPYDPTFGADTGDDCEEY